MSGLFKLALLFSATVLTLSAPAENGSQEVENETDKFKENNDKETIYDSDLDTAEKIIPDKTIEDLRYVVDSKGSAEEKKIKIVVPSSDKVDHEENISTINANVVKKPSDTNQNLDVIAPPKDYDVVLKKVDDTTNILKDSVKDLINNSEDSSLALVDTNLRDVASAVAEAVTNLPTVPNPESGNKFSQIFGHFVGELLQVPMVILHAISNAIANLTTSKVTSESYQSSPDDRNP